MPNRFAALTTARLIGLCGIVILSSSASSELEMTHSRTPGHLTSTPSRAACSRSASASRMPSAVASAKHQRSSGRSKPRSNGPSVRLSRLPIDHDNSSPAGILPAHEDSTTGPMMYGLVAWNHTRGEPRPEQNVKDVTPKGSIWGYLPDEARIVKQHGKIVTDKCHSESSHHKAPRTGGTCPHSGQCAPWFNDILEKEQRSQSFFSAQIARHTRKLAEAVVAAQIKGEAIVTIHSLVLL